MIKRMFDVLTSLVGLILLSPVLIGTGIAIRLDSKGPVFFRQERVGRGFRRFLIFKFRTMVQDAQERGSIITVGDDPRVTRVGRTLRKTKLDELPQLYNVLKGDMSVVGPRPEVERYVELFNEDYEQILKLRPGITDLASLRYTHEAEMLARFQNPEEEYVQRILPDKIRLGKQYVEKSSFLFDVSIIIKTLLRITSGQSFPNMKTRRRILRNGD